MLGKSFGNNTLSGNPANIYVNFNTQVAYSDSNSKLDGVTNATGFLHNDGSGTLLFSNVSSGDITGSANKIAYFASDTYLGSSNLTYNGVDTLSTPTDLTLNIGNGDITKKYYIKIDGNNIVQHKEDSVNFYKTLTLADSGNTLYNIVQYDDSIAGL